MAARLQGFRREQGTARGYINAQGQRLSYRQYRNLLKTANAVQPLDLAGLANRRVKQGEYNDVVKRAADRRRKELEASLKAVRKAGDTNAAAALETDLRRVKSGIMKSEQFKADLALVKSHLPKSSTPAERFAFEQTKKDALTRLGRREGLPDWVPVGLSDKRRAGKLRRDRIDNAIRVATRPSRAGGFNTRGSK